LRRKKDDDDRKIERRSRRLDKNLQKERKKERKKEREKRTQQEARSFVVFLRPKLPHYAAALEEALFEFCVHHHHHTVSGCLWVGKTMSFGYLSSGV